MTFTQLLLAHPYVGALIFFVLAVISLCLFAETSDGSRGGDASGTGSPNPAGALLFFGLSAMSVCCLMGWIK